MTEEIEGNPSSRRSWGAIRTLPAYPGEEFHLEEIEGSRRWQVTVSGPDLQGYRLGVVEACGVISDHAAGLAWRSLSCHSQGALDTVLSDLREEWAGDIEAEREANREGRA